MVKDGSTTKNESDIRFSRVLDLTKNALSDLYILQSIILHGGPAEKGHFVNATTGPRSGTWYIIDEGKVTEGDLKVLLEEVDKSVWKVQVCTCNIDVWKG